MTKFTLTILIVSILFVHNINYSNAWPFGNTDKVVDNLIKYVNELKKLVVTNDKDLREQINERHKMFGDVLNNVQWKLNEVVLNLNICWKFNTRLKFKN